MSARLHVHGAAGGVTGSCYRLETDRARLLIDCGLFQGPKTLKELNYRRFPFDAAALDGVLLTHAHVDHSGLLPKLMLAGFRGPIHATAGTRELCAVMLPDAGGIQEHEVEQLNRRMQRRGRRAVEPIYTAQDGRACVEQFAKVRYGDWIEPAPGVRARWWDAGHILGSASIEVELTADEAGGAPLRLLFSGDIGPGHSDFLADPQGPAGVDHLIMESTYGKAERPPLSGAERRRLLAAEVQAAHAAGGPLLIPAFAVERTQELIADLIQLMQEGAAPQAQIFLDSPLAVQAFDVFFRRGRAGDGANPYEGIRGSGLFHPTPSPDDSRALERLAGWHVIIAASGMCDAGRIRHHLKRLLWRREATVLLVGYQATGTLGRFLQEGQRRVRIQGEEIRVHAAVRSLDVYSGHADGPALTAWAQARAPVAGQVFLTHGEPESRLALRRRLEAAGFASDRIVMPELDECFRLFPTASQREAAPSPRLAAGAATRLDWHNARSRLLLELDEALEAASDDEARMAILEQLGRAVPASAQRGPEPGKPDRT
jgi:metallo-beta-lactamase family protein